MRKTFSAGAATSLAFILLCATGHADEPSPTPSPSPSPGFSTSIFGSNSFVDQSASGPGITPSEAAAFQAGLPLSPMSPYDWFSSAPTIPGIAGVAQYELTATDRMRAITAQATFGFTGIAGDGTNAAYWAEPLLGNASPHWNHLYNPGIVFPTQPGKNDFVGAQLSVPVSASLANNDGNWQIRGGYFDLAQTNRFVFVQPGLPNALLSTGIQTAETLGPGMPSLDAWTAPPIAMQLLGGDALVKIRSASIELTDALLPALSNTGVRLLNGSIVIDRGNYGRFSAQVSHIDTSGAPILTTTYFGVDQTFYPGPQGRLFTSMLADQHQTLAGVSALVHPLRGYDALFEFGRGWYNAGLVAEPGTNSPGNYGHVALTRHFNKTDDFGVEYYGFGPRYASIILPYGVPENVWSAAWAWPGNWLKSNYQSIDNSIIGINREGFRTHADMTRGRLELHADAYVWRQLEPIDNINAPQEGWADGYFLPQINGDRTLGWQRQVNLYAAWHLLRDDIAVDSVWDRSYRPTHNDPVDFVSMNYPQVVVSVQHHWNKKAVGVMGYGRYSANGMWATTPVLGIYGAAFVGGEWDFGNQQLLVQLRRQGLTGVPSQPGGPATTMRGLTLIVDQHFTI